MTKNKLRGPFAAEGQTIPPSAPLWVQHAATLQYQLECCIRAIRQDIEDDPLNDELTKNQIDLAIAETLRVTDTVADKVLGSSPEYAQAQLQKFGTQLAGLTISDDAKLHLIAISALNCGINLQNISERALADQGWAQALKTFQNILTETASDPLAAPSPQQTQAALAQNIKRANPGLDLYCQ